MSEYSRKQLAHATAALYATPGTEPKRAPRKKRNTSGPGSESYFQKECVKWFRKQYGQDRYHFALWSVPNGGYRPGMTGGLMTAEGATSGVSDLVLVWDRIHFIEIKKPGGGRHEPEQIEFQKHVESMGHPYHLIDNLDDFMKLIRGVVG